MLFCQADPIVDVIYLLSGTLAMEIDGISSYEISGDTFKAKFPLASGKTYSVTAHTKTDIRFIRVSKKVYEAGNIEYHQKRYTPDLSNLIIGPILKTSGLFNTFCSNFRNNQLSLPSLPNIALKLQREMRNDIGIAESAKIVQLDPAITARLIQVANSPIYLSAQPVKDCLTAVNRLGLNATRNLVISVSMKQSYQFKTRSIQQRMQQQWKHSIYLSSLCFVLAASTKQVDPDKALLAGLISNIGVMPFMQFADGFSRDLYTDEEVDLAAIVLNAPIGTSILQKWGFPDDLVEIPALAENWFHDSGDKLTVSDIVILSKLHSYINTPKMAKLPCINSIPAYEKLNNGSLCPELSLGVLNESKKKVNEVIQFFSG